MSATELSSNYWSELSHSVIDTTVGDYQFVEDLGHGSYGGLFLGQHTKTKDYVAIKVLSKSGLTDEQRQLQQVEIDVQTELDHPSLLALHTVMQDTDYIYMVMDLCDQGDLFDYVINTTSRSSAQVKSFFTQILQGIEQMHAQGIYHRDIKLENILLKTNSADDDLLDCKVADFGLATRDRLSMEFGCGSATYLAPEHFGDEDSVGTEEVMPYDAAASDVWSLGILLLALMFGRNPWQEANTADRAFAEYKRHPGMIHRHLFPELSKHVVAFLQQSVLTVDPAQRVSVSEMLKQFQALPALYADEEDEVDSLGPLTPVDIPIMPEEQKKDEPRYDSAFFSMTGHTGMSWSDMVEEDEYLAQDYNKDDTITPQLSADAPHHDDDDDTMFVHNNEKESWWL
ncbi:hypothetical protein [Absidia glauca]|uniref:non-specific serine/threonine protein kinase n=1 Tax=Absidia glauca TaxID=4829 RepID=A0A163K4P9_ABSGL|nr:hypothetical protein [Absidia glauca]